MEGRMDAYARFRPESSTVPASGPVAIRILPEVARFSLRIAPADLGVASEAFGVALPGRIGEIAAFGSRRALCLGPDEWLLHAEEEEAHVIEAAFAERYAATPHSLVAIGDREISISLEGEEAATLLSTGCPIDLERLAPGTGKRTIFDSVSVVLIREEKDRFTLEAWRSFMPHVLGLLETANRELAAGL